MTAPQARFGKNRGVPYVTDRGAGCLALCLAYGTNRVASWQAEARWMTRGNTAETAPDESLTLVLDTRVRHC